MTNFDFIFDTICVPYIFRKFIFWWNYDHGTPLCDTPPLEDTPLCDTHDELYDSKPYSAVFTYMYICTWKQYWSKNKEIMSKQEPKWEIKLCSGRNKLGIPTLWQMQNIIHQAPVKNCQRPETTYFILSSSHVEFDILIAKLQWQVKSSKQFCMHTHCSVILGSIGATNFLFTDEWREYILLLFLHFWCNLQNLQNQKLMKISTYTVRPWEWKY